MSDSRISDEDAGWLERALELGRRGWGHVHPNPLVGCVIVRGGEIVGEGYHRVFGGPHAEIVALEQAGAEASGATAYVSLEPCRHQGKTPPCAGALLGAGVRRVVYGARDPGVESGGGAEVLREGGVDVVGPVWSERRGRAENPSFFHFIRHGAPFVALKLAMSMDGRIAARAGERTRVTGVEAQRESHRLRAGFDAVMVGAGTVRADDPQLTPRLVPPGREMPRRILLDAEGTLSSGAAIFADREAAPVHVFVRDEVSEAAMERLEAAGAHVHPVPESDQGLDLGAVLSVCWDLGIRSILCEGGATLAASLLRERRVQRLYLFVAPVTFGAEGVEAFLDDAGALDWEAFEPAHPPELFGRDTLIVLDRQDEVGEG
jgi:diaminohydroxyphosphoribosylaminopyrimidine deaminase/5-amino-6-(5-phosphoribosylamino)uracil reductase